MSELSYEDNLARIAKLNEALSKSDLPYHTAETEQIQAERIQPAGEPAPEVDDAPYLFKADDGTINIIKGSICLGNYQTEEEAQAALEAAAKPAE